MSTMRRSALVTATFSLAAIACFGAHAETEVELRTRVISALRLVEVTSPPAPASRYRADDDPSTIEVIYMSDRADGNSQAGYSGTPLSKKLGTGEDFSADHGHH